MCPNVSVFSRFFAVFIGADKLKCCDVTFSYIYYCVRNYLLTMDERKRILVIDDEETLCEALRFNLEAEGYDVDTALSAEEALSRDLPGYDLFLVDVMMGAISGTQLAGILKSNPATASIPLIFCTARDGEDDMIAGLDLGADDYITKPYSLRNVSARVRSVLRRSRRGEDDAGRGPDVVSYQGLSVVSGRKVCMVDGEEVRMPRKEFEILRRLLADRGRIFSREELLREVWPGETVVLDRVVDVNITRIRRKIGRYGRHIVARAGYGYGFVE